jgi:hypothetical protein
VGKIATGGSFLSHFFLLHGGMTDRQRRHFLKKAL